MPEQFELANQPDSPVARANRWIEGMFGRVGEPVGRAFESAGGAFAERFAPSYVEPIRRGAYAAGKALPRTAAEALLTSRARPLAKAIGFGDVALRAYGETPETASLPQRLGTTAMQTAAFKLAPEIGGTLGRAGAQMAAPGNWLARRAGSALGTVGAFEGVNAASARLLGQPYAPLTPEHIAGTVASVLPWEVGAAVGEHLEAKTAKVKEDKAAQTTFGREVQPELPPLAAPATMKEKKVPAERIVFLDDHFRRAELISDDQTLASLRDVQEAQSKGAKVFRDPETKALYALSEPVDPGSTHTEQIKSLLNPGEYVHGILLPELGNAFGCYPQSQKS